MKLPALGAQTTQQRCQILQAPRNQMADGTTAFYIALPDTVHCQQT